MENGKLVEALEDFTQFGNDLCRLSAAGIGGVGDDVGEKNANALELLSDDCGVRFEHPRRLLRQNVQEEPVRLRFFRKGGAHKIAGEREDDGRRRGKVHREEQYLRRLRDRMAVGCKEIVEDSGDNHVDDVECQPHQRLADREIHQRNERPEERPGHREA